LLLACCRILLTIIAKNGGVQRVPEAIFILSRPERFMKRRWNADATGGRDRHTDLFVNLHLRAAVDLCAFHIARGGVKPGPITFVPPPPKTRFQMRPIPWREGASVRQGWKRQDRSRKVEKSLSLHARGWRKKDQC
jgi:hypothetical protein